MANILSQEEIDALLGVAQPEEAAGADATSDRGGRAGVVLPYDFRRPNRVSKEQLRFLQTIHETFGRQWGSSLSGYLRSMVDIEIVSADQLTYGEYVLSMPESTALFVFTMKPLEGSAILELNPSLILTIVDRLFGGAGAGAINRDLTSIETAVVTKLVRQGLEVLEATWRRIVPLQPELVELTKSPQMLQLLPNTETVILITFELRISDFNGILSICYPYLCMEPIIPNLSSRHALLGQGKRTVDEGPVWISRHLADSALPISVELGQAELTVSEFLKLRLGDVLKLRQKVEDPVSVLVGGQRMSVAWPGLQGRRRAVRLETALAADVEERQT